MMKKRLGLSTMVGEKTRSLQNIHGSLTKKGSLECSVEIHRCEIENPPAAQEGEFSEKKEYPITSNRRLL